MKKRIVQSLLLCSMMVSLSVPKVAPVGASEKLEIETTEQTKEENNYVNAGISRTTYDLLKTVDVSQQIPTISKNIDIVEGTSIEETVKDWYKVFTTTNVNVRKEPNKDSEVLSVLPFNYPVFICEYNSEWVEITYNNESAYISSKYFTDIECPYTEYSVPNNKGFKSYMPHLKCDGKSIFEKSSNQYKLQQYAYTGNYGIRQVNGRYCVAIGTAFNADVGTYIDLVLANGTVIPCVIGDIKADIHTESNNIVTSSNGCVSEFIVDKKCLPSKVNNNKKTGTGDISDCCDDWDSPVTTIRIYNKNILK